MAQIELNSNAEKMALESLMCKPFSSINLIYIKENLATMLSHIGDNGMFAEYTMHDISHVDGMLQLLDKIIPDDTRYIMTKADWLMTVLSIYFHDLGMLIPIKEFNLRNDNTDFQIFKSEALKKSSVINYVNTIKEEVDRDKFLYQEYIRKNHGVRICDWIANCDASEEEPYKLVGEMLAGLDKNFRKDLAKICKSHQDDELDPSLLSVDEAYGSSDDEKVNLLYVAVLLRTSDLLHVTHERTPDVEFRIISPKNEISIIEWAKQQSVTSVGIHHERDGSGNVDKNIKPFAFEIQARFNDDKGYFSFKEYVQYAVAELKKCNRWCEESREKNKNSYCFPWKDIDTSRVKAEGFNNEKLKFEIDQRSILKLLTGHTLYNDSTVVLRELIQNAVDAGRLQNASEKLGSAYKAKVVIEWNSKMRRLRISDNATGMDSSTITNYLLKVGSSKYSSETFRKEYPDFHSISRFGIGLLTCFMISDDVDIYTLDAKEDECHLLKIRNLNGEYLMRNDADRSNILEGKHGTTFELYVRDNIDFSGIETQIKQWVVVPESDVQLIIDGSSPIRIGRQTEKECLEDFSRSLKGVDLDCGNYRIYTDEKNGVKIACLQKMNPANGVWSLYACQEDEMDYTAPIGICIEGIKVTFATPGLKFRRFVVLANCTGKNSPTTNVARDALEANSALDEMYRTIYDLYLQTYASQFEELSNKFSVSWAVSEMSYQIDRFNSDYPRSSVVRRDLFMESLSSVSCCITDDGEKMRVSSISELPAEIYTLDSVAYKSAISLLKDVPSSNKTPLCLLRELDSSSKFGDIYLQDYMMANTLKDLFVGKYDVSSVWADIPHRRIKLCWIKASGLWKRVVVSRGGWQQKYFFVPLQEKGIAMNGVDNNNLITCERNTFLLPGTSVGDFLKNISEYQNVDEVFPVLCGFIFELIEQNVSDKVRAFGRYFDSDDNYLKQNLWDHGFLKDDFLNAIKQTEFHHLSVQNYYHRM